MNKPISLLFIVILGASGCGNPAGSRKLRMHTKAETTPNPCATPMR